MTVADIIILEGRGKRRVGTEARGHEGLVVNEGVWNCNRGHREGTRERPRIMCCQWLGQTRSKVGVVPEKQDEIQLGIKFRRNEEGEEFK